mmetsp:Transcript_20430/g.55004  ORF Transcript_20430/g.55004 Transcript_20430/m.55004 type:complete len:221 (+) Transcript_20430:511-1173(+)
MRGWHARCGCSPSARARRLAATDHVLHRVSLLPRGQQNNGHTVKVIVDPGSYANFNGTRYDMLQFHFHSPSEHHLDGLAYPMETHFVYKDSASGSVLVLAVLWKLGLERSTFLDQLWLPNLPAYGESRPVSVSLNDLDVSGDGALSYSGSFTTPPCTQGVNWVLLKHTPTMAEEQMHEFEQLIGHSGCHLNCFVGNNRPVQPLNGRTVRRSALQLTPIRG